MALIDKADPLWPRVSAAFNAVQGPTAAGISADDHAVNCITRFIVSVVKNYEAGIALQPQAAAIKAASDLVDTDFVVQTIKAKPVEAAPAEEEVMPNG